MIRAFWTLPAQDDLAAIDDYYAALDRTLADRIGRRAIAAADFLADHPYAGEDTANSRRRWRVARTPYILLYRIMPHGVEILRVRHERQDWLKQS